MPKGIRLSSSVPITKDPKDNLAFKAAELLLNYKKIRGGLHIKITKNVPIAAGLGGGSSDAATVLLGINNLLRLKLDKKTLIRLGSRLGSDVPFFLLDEPFALGKGRGDRLKPIKSKKRFWHLLIYPGVRLPTKVVYEAFDVSKCLTTKKANAKIQLPLKLSMDFRATEEMLYNDLEAAAVAQKSVIGTILKRLATLLGKKAVVSGSGPSVFCLYRTRKEAERAKRAVLQRVPGRERRTWQIFTMRTC